MDSSLRVVFDTNTVISALLFSTGNLSWLRQHWQNAAITPLVSQATAAEIIRVLCYKKFKLDRTEIDMLLGEYLPFVETVQVSSVTNAPRCTDQDDQMFIDLAIVGKANILVSGDKEVLAMGPELQLNPGTKRYSALRIMTAADYKNLVGA